VATQRFEVIVIGVGAMGSAACLALARRGVRVLGLEQFSIPHEMGSSHGDSRMIRLCYYEHPDYVPLLRRAYELWADLEREAGCTLLIRTGGLYLGLPGSEFVLGSQRAAQEHALPHEMLDRAEIARRFPQFHVSDDAIALFEPSAGILLPEMVVSAQAELALRRGAAIHAVEPVRDWRADARSVRVTTSRGEYYADRLIICGGAWTGTLVRSLGVRLLVTRQVLGWLWPRKPDAFALGRLPVWAHDQPGGTQHYGFPMLPHSSRPGLKIAHHHRGEPADPATVDRSPRPGDEEDFLPQVRRILPEADGPLLSMRICLYTNSPDSHFIVDRHPEHERVTMACGFSGHGFKFASVMGEALADLAMHGRSAHPIGFLGLDRLSGVK